jgi:hypothetical protein
MANASTATHIGAKKQSEYTKMIFGRVRADSICECAPEMMDAVPLAPSPPSRKLWLSQESLAIFLKQFPSPLGELSLELFYQSLDAFKEGFSFIFTAPLRLQSSKCQTKINDRDAEMRLLGDFMN